MTSREADLATVDIEPLIADRLNEGPTLLDLAFARLNCGHVADLYVAGRRVVREGKLVALDFPAAAAKLTSQARRAASGDDNLANNRARREAIRHYYRNTHHIT